MQTGGLTPMFLPASLVHSPQRPVHGNACVACGRRPAVQRTCHGGGAAWLYHARAVLACNSSHRTISTHDIDMVWQQSACRPQLICPRHVYSCAQANISTPIRSGQTPLAAYDTEPMVACLFC